MGGLLITSIASGQAISRTGRYKAFPIVGMAVLTVGLYLLSTLDSTSSVGTIFAFMFVVGLGLGMVMQVLVLAVQNAVDYADWAWRRRARRCWWWADRWGRRRWARSSPTACARS